AEPAAKDPLTNKPLVLAAAVTGGVGAALLAWAILPSSAGESSAEVAPVSAVAPVDPTPVSAEVPAPPAPVQAPPPPAPAPAPPAPVPAAPGVPTVITFGGGAACFPFQPDC